jgi:hypothetical protein
MTELRIKNHLPLGIAWNWVKFSFATFREKPINFLVFALGFIIFSLVPFLGSFLAVLVVARIYLSAKYIEDNQPVGVSLNLGMIFRQRNIVSYGIFNMFFDFMLMSLLREFMAALGIDASSTATMLSDHRTVYLLIGMSLLRAVILGISLAIITFNAEIKVLQALKMSWVFIYKNWVVLALGLFLLLPFLLIPLYLAALIALSFNNAIAFGLSALVVVIFMLLFIAVTTIFSYKLYRDGISHE